MRRKKYLILVLILFSVNCGSPNKELNDSDNTFDTLEVDKMYKSIKAFYSDRYHKGSFIIKIRENFLYDTCYLMIKKALPFNIAELYFYNKGNIISYRPMSKLIDFLNSSKKHYKWDQLSEENIDLFFSLLMLDYHHYSAEFPTEINKFVQEIKNIHDLTSEIRKDKVILLFWYIDYSNKLKHKIILKYLNENKIFSIEFLETKEFKVKDIIE